MVSFIGPGRAARGLDRVAGWTIRAVGVASFFAAGLAALLAGAAMFAVPLAAWAAQEGDKKSAGQLLLLIAAGFVITASTAAWWGFGAHHAFRAWCLRQARPIAWLGASLVAVGATFWAPYVFLDAPPPGQLDLLWLRVGMLVAGLILLGWARDARRPA